MKKINYFDLGLYRGWEIKHIIYNIFPELKIENYNAYGFEAHPLYAQTVKESIANDRVEILNKAISSKSQKIKLYIASNGGIGNSIYSTKNNVDKNNYVEVEGIVFSEWLEDNCPNFKDEVNILKVNIEGAEWDLFTDLVSKGYHKYFIFCGAGHDVEKVKELDPEKYWRLIKENSIELLRFSEWKPYKNFNIKEKIQEVINDEYIRRNI